MNKNFSLGEKAARTKFCSLLQIECYKFFEKIRVKFPVETRSEAQQTIFQKEYSVFLEFISSSSDKSALKRWVKSFRFFFHRFLEGFTLKFYFQGASEWENVKIIKLELFHTFNDISRKMLWVSIWFNAVMDNLLMLAQALSSINSKNS